MKTYTPILLFLFLPFFPFSQVIYVDIDATGNNNGTSWADAYTDLAEAMDNAIYGDSIWIAEGTYFPTNDNNRHKHFTQKNGVKLFGGFTGNEANFEERDWENNLSILDGNIGDGIDSTDNVYTVLYVNLADNTTQVDGLVIQNGYADGQDSIATESGGGIFLDTDNNFEIQLLLRNCVIQYNYASVWGGGLMTDLLVNNAQPAINYPPVSLWIENCVFQYNVAVSDGGGAAIRGNPYDRPTLIKKTIFQHNQIFDSGSGDGSALALYCVSDTSNSPRIFQVINCIFLGNNSWDARTGVFVFAEENGITHLLIDSCNFQNNLAPNSDGSCFFFEDVSLDSLSSVTIQNSNFENNIAESGTIIIEAPRHDVLINNCRIIGNETDDGGSSFYASGNVKVVNSLFANNFQISNSPGLCLASGHPLDSSLLLNCTFVGNQSNDPYFCFFYTNSSLSGASHMIQNCIFRGSKYEPFNSDGSYIQPLTGIKPVIDNCMFDIPICSTVVDSNLICGPGIIFAEPIFVDSAGGDFRLCPSSPGINSGADIFYPSYFPGLDLADQERIQEGQIDMGAYELAALKLEIENIEGFICHGDTIGSILFQLPNTLCSSYTITDPMGSMSTDLFYDQLGEGEYTFILEDEIGRTDTVTIILTEPDPIVVSIQIEHATNAQSFDGSLVVEEITGGIPPYDLLWSLAGDTSWQLEDLGPALYALTVTDSLGCEFIEYYLVEAITSTKEITIESQILVYPNPFEKEIIVKFPNEINAIQVFDYTGRLMEGKSNLNAGEEIRLGTNFLPGVYLIVLYDESGRRYNRRVVKL